MAGTDPLSRFALKVYRMRAYAPCATTWPCDEPGEEHVHRCFRHQAHLAYHKCACGALHRKGKS